MPIGNDNQHTISPEQVFRAVTEWVTGILNRKRQTGSFGNVGVQLTIKQGEVVEIGYTDYVTTKVTK